MKRRAFTLVELMVVLLILGILIALLLPAINGAVRTARDAQVTAEIQSLKTGLADFRSKYGHYPPSRLILREDGIYDVTDTRPLSALSPSEWVGTETFGTATNDLTYGELAARSHLYLSHTWGRAYFVKGQPLPASPQQHDFNGNGRYDRGSIYLEGHECLVFFLGGIPIPPEIGGPGVSGFAANLMQPFSNSFVDMPNLSMSMNRTIPMTEFAVSRLVDRDGDGMPGYVDTLGSGTDARCYAYFSANQGYDPNDVNFTVAGGELDSGDPTETGSRAYNLPSRPAAVLVGSSAPNPYTTNHPTVSPVNLRVAFVNPEGYQIISAGRDGLYGLGGQYKPADLDRRLPEDSGSRQGERDNISNFASGHLD